MHYLIDTQILIWFQLNDSQLNPEIYAILTSRKNRISVSRISLLEIAIKQKIGKLSQLPASIDEVVFVLNQDGFDLLPIETAHIVAYESVPLFADHRDPFDHLLIATAFAENASIISADEKFRLYVPQLKLIEA